MRKTSIFINVFIIIVAIYCGYIRNSTIARLFVALLLTVVFLKIFHSWFYSSKLQKVDIPKRKNNLLRYLISPRASRNYRVYNVFVSHSWSYHNAYDNLIDLLEEEEDFYFVDHSVPKDRPIHTVSSSTELYNAIKEKMTPCDIVIVVAGVYATYSTWIPSEIHIARNEFDPPKPILAVIPFGAQRSSNVAKDPADLVVNWNTKSITDAIRRLVNFG